MNGTSDLMVLISFMQGATVPAPPWSCPFFLHCPLAGRSATNRTACRQRIWPQ